MELILIVQDVYNYNMNACKSLGLIFGTPIDNTLGIHNFFTQCLHNAY